MGAGNVAADIGSGNSSPACGSGVDCDFQAAPGEQALIAHWRPGLAPA